MLDTTMSDANKYPLKLNDLIVASGCSTWEQAPAKIQWASGQDQIKALDPDIPNVGLKGDLLTSYLYMSDEFADFEGSVMSIDPAGRGKDKTAYCVLKMLHGVLYLTAIGGLDGGYSEETLRKLAGIAKAHKVNDIVIESNFGDGMATQLLKPILAEIHPCNVEEVRHSIQKEKRIIDTLEPIMNNHKLVVDESIIKDDFKFEPDHQLFRQMTRITRDKGALRHDDQIDALAIAANYWVEVMDRDQVLSYKQHKSDLLDVELDKFMETTTGRKTKKDRWI
jgi:predicted phage terminase large subunit-like protein